MTELDPTGARLNANNPKLSRDAERARKAKARAEWWKQFWSKFPVAALLSIAGGIVMAATLFDWFMSSRGWSDLLPNLGLFAGLGAAASVGFWYYGVHKAIEEFLVKNWLWGGIWAGIAVAGYLICVVGVGLATLTNTSQARIAAEESRKAYAALIAQRDDLQDSLDIYNVEYWEARIAADERTAKARLNIAKATLGMADLDVDKGCAQKLNFNQQRACAYWNGGTDPHTGSDVVGLLTEIEQDKAGLKKAKANTETLATLETEIQNFTVKTGDETSRALVFFFKSETAGGQAQLVIFAGLSALFLLGGGFFTAWFFRRILKGKTA